LLIFLYVGPNVFFCSSRWKVDRFSGWRMEEGCASKWWFEFYL